MMRPRLRRLQIATEAMGGERPRKEAPPMPNGSGGMGDMDS